MTSPRDFISDLRYERDFITLVQEQEILAFIQTQAHWSWLGKKKRLSFGWDYGLSKKTLKRGQPVPPIFCALALRLYEGGMMPELAQQVVVQEYQPGQGLGQHIDLLPQTTPELRNGFGPVVVSLSLLSSCVMRFSHPDAGRGPDITLEPRSALAISGEMRTDWLHEIMARTVRNLRISITFRTVVLVVPAPYTH
jgi:alkylated DNA repair dioxygenase AlkB